LLALSPRSFQVSNMKAVVVIALGLLAIVAARSLESEFDAFVSSYGKTYASSAEREMRFRNFKTNMKHLEAQQRQMSRKGQNTWTAGVTQFFDLSPKEMSLWKGGRKWEAQALAISCLAHGVTAPQLDTQALPTAWDWRTKNPPVVNPIKNQGQCGSCWAFSTIGSIESAWAISGKPLASFSEQEVVDCSHGCSNEPPYGAVCNQGCDGGWQWNAFSDIVTWNGVDTEASYPYTAQTGTCVGVNNTGNAPLKNYTCLSAPQGNIANEANMAAYVVAHGPISIAMDASILESYTSGIIVPDGDCSQVQLDHALIIVGYGHDATAGPFWIVRNSWGAAWGEAGYFRIIRGKNACGIAAAVSSPILA